ncbi:MAG: ABC transporter ATP-binding protein [Pseudodonghicola sp.]
MGNGLLEIVNVSVSAGGQPVLHGIDLTIPPGEMHVLLGPNGSGKSSLLGAIMGLPAFEVTAGEIRFDGTRIERLAPDARAALGLGMAFQRPPSLDGVTLEAFSAALHANGALAKEAEALDMAGFMGREINVGFSGGEIKRWEILKLFLQNPRFMMFDEPESGVDLEHIAAIGGAIDRLMNTPGPEGVARSALVITHTGFILDHIQANQAHMMIDGKIVYSGEAVPLFAHIKQSGYTVPAGEAGKGA